MATNERFMRVPPDAIWQSLAEAGEYSDWVVGSKAIRAADATWPQPGSRLHHTVGVGPLTLRDHTEAIETRPKQLLKLRVRARPLPSATVTLELEPVGAGTRVRMTELLEGQPRLLARNPLVELFTRARNAKSLERLERLAARRAG